MVILHFVWLLWNDLNGLWSLPMDYQIMKSLRIHKFTKPKQPADPRNWLKFTKIVPYFLKDSLQTHYKMPLLISFKGMICKTMKIGLGWGGGGPLICPLKLESESISCLEPRNSIKAYFIGCLLLFFHRSTDPTFAANSWPCSSVYTK